MRRSCLCSHGVGNRASLALAYLLVAAATALAQQTPPAGGPSPEQANKLAEMMCRQLPNVASIPSYFTRVSSDAGPAPPVPRVPLIDDDVFQALLRLGPYALPCLTEHLIDNRWMPDPRSEPLLGSPVVGDVAYIILMDMGVGDVLPAVMHKKPEGIRMDTYFIWPSVGDHRQRLQSAVRAWLSKHPDCCGALNIPWQTASPQVKFRMHKPSWQRLGSHSRACVPE